MFLPGPDISSLPYPYSYCPGIANTIINQESFSMPELAAPQSRRNPAVKKLAAAAPALRSRYGIERIGIFGLFARGEQQRGSDIDVLVDFALGHATLKNFVGLADYLESLFKRKVDLSTREGLDRYIREYVEAEVIWVEG